MKHFDSSICMSPLIYHFQKRKDDRAYPPVFMDQVYLQQVCSLPVTGSKLQNVVQPGHHLPLFSTLGGRTKRSTNRKDKEIHKPFESVFRS